MASFPPAPSVIGPLMELLGLVPPRESVAVPAAEGDPLTAFSEIAPEPLMVLLDRTVRLLRTAVAVGRISVRVPALLSMPTAVMDGAEVYPVPGVIAWM